MTIPQWNLFINGLIAALMVVFGIWIRHIVKQQEKLKDATIESLRAVNDSKDAMISRLTTDVAPNIVTAYAQVRAHADKMTADVLGLQVKLRAAGELSQVSIDIMYELGEAAGLNLALNILLEKLDPFFPPDGVPPSPTSQELPPSLLTVRRRSGRAIELFHKDNHTPQELWSVIDETAITLGSRSDQRLLQVETFIKQRR